MKVIKFGRKRRARGHAAVRGLVLAASMCVFIPVGPARAADTTGITATTIKIGMFGPLTGSASLWGYPINSGAIALYKYTNAHGGINGRQLEIVNEDAACNPAKAEIGRAHV